MTDKKHSVVYIDEHNNHIVDIPKEILQTLGWKEGTNVTLTAENGHIVIRKAIISQIIGNKELI